MQGRDYLILLSAALIALTLATVTANIVWRTEADPPPWLYTVTFGRGVNTTSDNLKIVFDPKVIHNLNNDSITFKAKIVNVGDDIVLLIYAPDAFRVNVYYEDGLRIPDSAYFTGSLLTLITGKLAPRDSLNFTLTWNYGTSYIGALKLKPGKYYVSGEFKTLDGILIESAKVEMTLSPNEVTSKYVNSVVLQTLGAALAVFGGVMLSAYIIRRHQRRTKPNIYPYYG